MQTLKFLLNFIFKLFMMAKKDTITIFLVDDNALYLKNLEIAFSSKPYYNVQTFATGELCLEKLSSNPDIIILDYYLNSISKNAMNGLETLIKIRAKNSHVPVILLSVESDPKVAMDCMNHKATEFIVKDDLSFSRLREIITSIFLDKQTENDLISQVHKAIYHSGKSLMKLMLFFKM
jgi:two-component system, OmpR family, response regulator